MMLAIATVVYGQPETIHHPVESAWTEADRTFLLRNLARTRQELVTETNALSPEQWNFKENPDRWSINQIVEHLAIWELLFMHEISRALTARSSTPHVKILPDSIFLDNPRSTNTFNAIDFTHPFSFAVPLGKNPGEHNQLWWLTLRQQSIDYLTDQSQDLRSHVGGNYNVTVYQYFIMMFSHTDRHLRQLKKIKTHARYPR